MKNIVRVNCKTGAITITPEGDVFRNLGGRSLTAHVLYEEVNPACDPLGPENKLIFAGMLLGGTNLTTTGRLSVGAKSPLTGGIKECNVGGAMGNLFSSHGVKALILEDVPAEKTMRVIVFKTDGGIALEDASDIAGKGNYDAYALLKQKYGENIGISCIGPAGERLYKNSAINFSEPPMNVPTRAAGRGGLGSVMASKGIKAIVIQKPAKPHQFEYVDAKAFREASAEIHKTILANLSAVSEYGTICFCGATIPTNIAPYKNFSGGKLTAAESEAFNVGTIISRVRSYGGSTGHACHPGCIIKCSNVVHDADGNYLTAGFEYETIELFGPNCQIFDVDDLARLDRFCDDFGFDTIEAGVSLGIYMDAGKLPWGDSKGALKLFESFYEGGEAADDFGAGAGSLGKKLRVKRVAVVKNQAMAAYDPRGLKGTGTTYAISTQGADHTSGSTITSRDLKPDQKEGQLDAAIGLQAAMCACDSSCCLLAWKLIAVDANKACSAAHAAALGEDWSAQRLFALGTATLKKERAFNRRAGMTPDDDKMPDFLYTEPNESGSVYDITHEEILEKWHAPV